MSEGGLSMEHALGLKPGASAAIAEELRKLLADVFALYMKTKNFHWHVSGPHFRDYHRMLDEQAEQLLEMTDPLAERGRKIGGLTLHSIGEIGGLQRIADDERTDLSPREMMEALVEDNHTLARQLRSLHGVCDKFGDIATASLIENWVDQTEGRAWYLAEGLRTV